MLWIALNFHRGGNDKCVFYFWEFRVIIICPSTCFSWMNGPSLDFSKLWRLMIVLGGLTRTAHQQFPSRPCRMSEGRGVRKTDHLTPLSLKLLQLISWGRSHFLIRCWTLSPSGKPTERGPGGKLSSTKFTEFWTGMKYQIISETLPFVQIQKEHFWLLGENLG